MQFEYPGQFLFFWLIGSFNYFSFQLTLHDPNTIEKCFTIHIKPYYYCSLRVKLYFYCVNTSYPMDNCLTSQRDRSRQTPEKDVLYILPAGPVTECAFARWRIVLPSCPDSVTSWHLFSFGAWSVQTCFLQRDVLKFICEFIHFILLLSYSTEVSTIMSSPGQKRGTCGHVLAIFDGHLKCA